MTKQRILLVLLLHVNFLAIRAASAALPLLVDDAGTVPPGELEFFLFYDLESSSGERLHAFPVELTVGVHPRADFTIASGYQYLDAAAGEEGWMDTTAAAKFAVWSGESAALSVEGLFKFPTASERKGLGSGDADAGINLAWTRTGELATVDLNAGYLFAGSSESDEVSLGAAVRREVSDVLEVYAEGLADVAVDDGPEITVASRIGLIWEFAESWQLGGGIGPSFGSGAPDFTGTVGIATAF